MSTKLFIQAMKALPDEFVTDDANFTHNDAFVIVAVRDKPEPMIFKKETMKWEDLHFEETTVIEHDS